jgi:hypothetical protein
MGAREITAQARQGTKCRESEARANRLTESYTQDRHYLDGEFVLLTRSTEIAMHQWSGNEIFRVRILRLRR